MPTFKLNKLVRDKLREIYAGLNQKAKYKILTPRQHKQQLINKIIEEANEIDIDSDVSEITDEIADLRQVLGDMRLLYGITEEQIKVTQKLSFDKKGGFIGGTFVETLELDDNDDWVEYYRKRPDIFPEEKQL
jgi:predicted house-cleaning noncanonical NTP pyrophosphatase (MazG superfamily)